MMIRNLKEFEKKFGEFAPKNAAPFEYSGVIKNTKIRKGPIKKISLTLDLTTDSVRKALENRSDLLIAFHAPDELKQKLLWHRKIRLLTGGKLTLYKSHLRLNFCRHGVNDILCKICSLDAIPLTFVLEDKFKVVGGVFGIKGQYKFGQILRKLESIKAPELRVYNKKKLSYKYKKILIASGSGFKKEFFETFKPDMIISGEVKHGVVYTAKEYGTTLIELTHWASEDRPLRKIAPILAKHLGVRISHISLPLDMSVY